MGVLFFKPIPRLAIWGHTLVKDYFGYHDFPDGVGQKPFQQILEGRIRIS